MDQALRFFVENYPSINAVLELKDYAERKLESVIVRLLYDSLRSAIHKWSWGNNNSNPEPWNEGDGVVWYDKEWITKKDKGVYFGVYKLGLSSVIARNDSDQKPFLYLYHDANFGNLNLKGITAAVRKVRTTLDTYETHYEMPDNGSTYLVKQSLGDVITIEGLKNPENMCARFLERAKTFTEVLAPIVYETAASNDRAK